MFEQNIDLGVDGFIVIGENGLPQFGYCGAQNILGIGIHTHYAEIG
jgi:hypothetical protein